MADISASVLLERIIHDALERSATDVHMQITHHHLQVQFRIAGHLVPFVSVPGHGETISRRVKALCRMDITEQRIPQDGAFRFESEAFTADIRVATLPTILGESVVLRMLPVRPKDVSFSSLGMSHLDSARMTQLLRCQSGLVLVTGPTGSGKTTTLYAMMTQLAKWGRRVLSIEDPVEARVNDCYQMEVRERIGLTFNDGLRALLRQDPDVIMVGEIRDEATAMVVLRASMTGHIVLSTTHASDAVGAATRLVDFGMSRPLLADVLRGVVVQEIIVHPCRACDGRGCADCSHSGEVKQAAPRFTITPMCRETTEMLGSDLPWTVVRERWGHSYPWVVSE